jgi:uncharacterized protein DUF1829/uncharacterized protein DUF1828
MTTMVQDIERLLDQYRHWLKDRTGLRTVNDDWVEITTPYLDRHNDALQIYARRENGGFVLSDDSYVIHDLEASGCALNTDKRQQLLRMTLKGFGVNLERDALQVHASYEDFPLRKHNLVQAMLAVNDLFYLAKPLVESLFYEDAVAWLDANDIRYTPKVKFAGTSGYDHLFDFVIPKSPRHQQPERIVQVVNDPTRQAAQTLILQWTDTREVRAPDSRAYALLNDLPQAVPRGVIEALSSYRINPVVWSERLQVVQELAA